MRIECANVKKPHAFGKKTPLIPHVLSATRMLRVLAYSHVLADTAVESATRYNDEALLAAGLHHCQ